MRRLLITFCLLLFASTSFAQMPCGGVTVASGTSCSNTTAESQTGATYSYVNIGQASYSLAAASPFAASATETICSAIARIYKVGTVTHNVKLCIYDDTGRIASTAWASNTAYSLNTIRIPTTPDGYYYKATTAGTSGSSEPTWNTTIGGTTSDGAAVWTNQGYNTAPGSQVGTCSDWVVESTLGTSEGDVSFSNISASLTSGSVYFVTLVVDSYDSTNNNIRWVYASSSGKWINSGTTSSWGLVGNDYQFKFTLRK